MSKLTILGILFFFSFILWGFAYLDSIHYFDRTLCEKSGDIWSTEENVCKTQKDRQKCSDTKEKWGEDTDGCDLDL